MKTKFYPAVGRWGADGDSRRVWACGSDCLRPVLTNRTHPTRVACCSRDFPPVCPCGDGGPPPSLVSPDAVRCAEMSQMPALRG